MVISRRKHAQPGGRISADDAAEMLAPRRPRDDQEVEKLRRSAADRCDALRMLVLPAARTTRGKVAGSIRELRP
jgi:hypothetical protein